MTRTVRNDLKTKIGFMQGRLSPLVDGKIQAFPWNHWRKEFESARDFGFALMEWTLDQDRLYDNPLMSVEGRKEIIRGMKKNGISVLSLTGDCFMQAPFYKTEGHRQELLLVDFENIIKASHAIGITSVLIPLVDGGRLENDAQEQELFKGCRRVIPLLKEFNVNISFESDFAPDALRNLIGRFDPQYFGITYDIGNSASLGYKPEEEIRAYGPRIINVHVKDRIWGGTTVPLGEGDADIEGVLRMLDERGYRGNYILQTARAADGAHGETLCRYRDMVLNWLEKEEA